MPKSVRRCNVETILLPAELSFSWGKWIDGHGLRLCTSYPALKDLDQLHKGEMHFYLPLLKMVPTSDLVVLTVNTEITSPNTSEPIFVARERQK